MIIQAKDEFKPTEFIEYHGESLPVIPLDVLVESRCNFTDQEFRNEVNRFMRDFMPGMPLDLLDTEDVEKWSMEETAEVTEVEVRVDENEGSPAWVVDSTDLSDAAEDAVREWLNENYPLAATSGGELADGSAPVYDVDDGLTLYLVLDMESNLLDHDCIFEYEREADRRLDDERENGCGFPWAWSWFWLPIDRIKTHELQAAGFVVGTYKDEHRLCGIDGGGYSFEGAHFAQICAIWNWNRRPPFGYVGPTNTDRFGPCFVRP
jgi:hypothetical protein